MKKNLLVPIVLVLSATIGAPMIASAVSFSPFLEEHRQLKEKTIMKAGSPVYMFHSGTPDVKKTIAVNDIAIVYRENSSCELNEVGKIRVLSYSGNNYLKGEVIEGEIKEGDIARKGSVALLVILPDERCEH